MTATKLTWEDDLDKSATKYHPYGAWIAIIFDPFFGITDYLNIPHAFGQIMTLRISIAVITVFALEEVIEELNKCFSAFDTIVERYNLEKIKTNGDAYMCAGGLPVANDTNPVDAIRAGLAIQEYMTAYKNDCIAKGEP